MIKWILYSDNVKVIDNDFDGIFTDELVEISDCYGKHKIDRNNKIWERIDKNNSFIIDCNNNTFKIIFDDKELTYDIDTNYIDNGNEIIIEYSYGEEVKKLIVRSKV